MADISGMVERLVEAGCNPAVAACVVAEVFTAGVLSADFRGQKVDETAERRRAKDRDRKRLLRGNPQTSAEIGGIPKEALTVLPTSKNPEVKQEKVRKRKQPLSAEFRPKESHFEAAAKLSRDRQYVLDKFEDMRLWATANGIVKIDWDATLHGFLRRDAKNNEQANGKHQGKPNVVDIAKRWAEGFESETGDGIEGHSGAVLRIPQR